MAVQTPLQKQPQPISFENGRQAEWVIVPPDADANAVLAALGLAVDQPVVVVSGSTRPIPDRKKHRLADLLSRGVANAAKESKAVIITGGTQAGVIELTGLGVAERGRATTLIGVAPLGKVNFPGMPETQKKGETAPLDPNHTHFVLVESDQWGGETDLIFRLAKAIAGSKTAATVLFGGNPRGIAMQEVLRTVRNKSPLVVVEGSQRLADEISRQVRLSWGRGKVWKSVRQAGQAIRRWLTPSLKGTDTLFNEVVEDGKVKLLRRNAQPVQLQKILTAQLKDKPADTILLRAWTRFATYDKNAARHQRIYRLMRNWPLILGVVTTALVLIYGVLTNPPTNPKLPAPFDKAILLPDSLAGQIFHFFIILFPIVTALCLAAESQFKPGNKWLLLRYYAEDIKKDIYSYRVLSSLVERDPKLDLPDEPLEVSASLTSIGQRLMRTEVNESALWPYDDQIPPKMYGAAEKDDGFSPMSPEDYIKIRINEQINFYSGRTNKLEKQLQPRQWMILLFGALGSLLAALGGNFQYWIPLTVAIVSALTAYLEYQQVSQTIIKYNQALTKLTNLADNWVAYTKKQQEDPMVITRLVDQAEQVMQSEHLGWVQQMQTTRSETDQSGKGTGEAETKSKPKETKKTDQPG